MCLTEAEIFLGFYVIIDQSIIQSKHIYTALYIVS